MKLRLLILDYTLKTLQYTKFSWNPSYTHTHTQHCRKVVLNTNYISNHLEKITKTITNAHTWTPYQTFKLFFIAYRHKLVYLGDSNGHLLFVDHDLVATGLVYSEKLWMMVQRQSRWKGQSEEFWHNVVHRQRKWQTIPVFLPGKPWRTPLFLPGEKERYTQLNAEFWRIAKRDKKVFLNEQ